MSPDFIAALEALDHAISETTSEQAPALSLALTARLAALAALSMVPRTEAESPAPAERGNKLLTRKEAAALLGVAESWLSRRQGRLPFEVRLGKRVPRYNSQGIDSWIRSHKGKP